MDKHVYCFLWLTANRTCLHAHSQPLTKEHADKVAQELSVSGALLVTYAKALVGYRGVLQ